MVNELNPVMRAMTEKDRLAMLEVFGKNQPLLMRGRAREANRTDPVHGLVYWQTRRRLADLGLVRHAGYRQEYELTAEGWLVLSRLRRAQEETQ